MRAIPASVSLSIGLAALLGGCPRELYDTLVPTSVEEVDLIRNDEELSGQEKREQLEALGLSPLTINALLRDDETANQFGGDLRSAYTKLVAPNFTSLTPDEIQILGREATDIDADTDVSIDDEQAQEIADFFDERAIESPEELEAFLDAGGSIADPQLSNIVNALFLDFDPDLLVPQLP